MQQEQNGLLQELYEGYQGALRFVARKSGIPYEEIFLKRQTNINR